MGVGVLLITLFFWRAPLLRMAAVQLSDRSVPTISPQSLAEALSSNTAPLLLDVRSEAEFKTSHLPGAVHFPPGSPISDALRTADTIVAYCSVGVRSSREVARLRDAGLENVSDLEGSIFRWARENRPLVGANGPTAQVHPYDAVWGQLLPKRLRAFPP